MKLKQKFCVIVLVLCIYSCSYSNPNFLHLDVNNVSSFTGNLEWKFESKGEYNDFGEPPCVADLDGNGLLEIVFCSGNSEGRVNCLDYSGKELWTFYTEHFVLGAPSIADLDGDGTAEILINSVTTLYCLDNEGKEKWSYKIGYIIGVPCIADIDNDGELEIILGAFPGHERTRSNVYCLDIQGDIKWVYTHSGAIWYAPAVADLDDDNTLELLFSSLDNKLYCFNHLGEEEWNFASDGIVKKPPSVGDLDHDGTLEVLFTSYDNFTYCLNHTGGEEWRYTSGTFSSLPIIADVNNDRFLEVIFSSWDQTLTCLNHTGGEEWRFLAQGQPSNSVVADLDSDGTLEVIVGAQDGILYCISHIGGEEWQYDLNVGRFSSPCIADINADGVLDILISSAHPSSFYCFSITDTTSSGGSPWHRERGSNFNTGNIDSDSDYLDDVTEEFYKTDKTNPDTDNDDLLDGLEVQIGLNPLINDANEDGDDDGLTNFDALKTYHTSIFTADTDRDGRKDGWEIEHGSDPLRRDNWTYLFGLYFLPMYGGIIAAVIIPIRRRQIKTSRITEK